MNAHWAALNPPGMAPKEAEALEGLTGDTAAPVLTLPGLTTGDWLSGVTPGLAAEELGRSAGEEQSSCPRSTSVLQLPP
jgi:hypothetical protein